MPIPRTVPSRPRGILLALLALLALPVVAALNACGTSPSVPSVVPSPSVALPSPDPTPVATPSPTPLPTPRYTNQPDPELAALIPARAGSATVVVPDVAQFGLTPGDMGEAYGELGTRFSSLVVAYIEVPRTTLYAMRVDGEPPTTEDLEPYLATAGRKVGIAGLDPEPWSLETFGDRRAWTRGEDNATATGTRIYTWAADGFVFLLIGVDDGVNRALLDGLPGEPPPTPTPRPSPTPRSGGSGGPSPSGTAAASPSG